MAASMSRLGRIVAGWVFLVVLAPIGWLLPVLPGTLFFLIGLVLLSSEFTWARRLTEWLKQTFPSLTKTGDSATRAAAEYSRRATRLFSRTAGYFVAALAGVMIFLEQQMVRPLFVDPEGARGVALIHDAMLALTVTAMFFICSRTIAAHTRSEKRRARFMYEMNHQLYFAIERLATTVPAGADEDLRRAQTAINGMEWSLLEVLDEEEIRDLRSRWEFAMRRRSVPRYREVN